MVYRWLALSMLSGLLALQVAGAAAPRALQESRDDSTFAMLMHTAFRARDGSEAVCRFVQPSSRDLG